MSFQKWAHQNDIIPYQGIDPAATLIEGPSRPTKTGTIPYLDEDGEYYESEEDIPDYDYFPVVNYKRVHGHSYIPYKGDSEWTQAANTALATQAQDNFQNRR